MMPSDERKISMKRRAGKVTITEIAKRSGVSSATVSLVLNEKGRISEATRKRVHAAMEESGFIPDQSAVNLRLGHSKLIGAVVNDISNPFFAELTAALEQTVATANFLLIVANSADDPERQRSLLSAMISHGVAGLVISPSAGTSAADFAVIKRREIPCVTCVREFPELGMDFVGSDDFSGAYLAVDHLHRLGHRRIAFIGGVRGTTTWILRQAGFRDAMHHFGSHVADDLILPGATNRDFGRQTAETLVQRKGAFTAVICFNDIVAIGLCAGLRSAGFEIGRDISVIGFDNLPASEMCAPPLTTIEVFPRGIGAEAGRLLLRRLGGVGEMAINQRLSPVLLVRGSTGPASEADCRGATDGQSVHSLI
jgi:DNA-binding LacI/PurR family transcriptional regulator